MSKAMAEIFLSTIMRMTGDPMANCKCSINEITEKASVTEKEILKLLEEGIIKGKTIFGVPYIINDTPWSVERKLKDYKGGGLRQNERS